MTVSFVGAQGAAAATVTIPAHQVGDLILIFAYRDGSNTTPTTPTAGGTVPAWNIIGSTGGNTNSSTFAHFTATATTTTSGTWTNATELICLVYRGARVGASAGGSGSATTTVNYPALTLQRTDNTSWAVGVAGHRTANNVDVAPTGMTNRAFAGTEAAGHDTNGTVTSWASTNVTVNASSAFRSWTVELRDKTIVLLADKGTFTLTGKDAGLPKGRNLIADKGTFTVSGQAANLVKASNKLLTADKGTFSISGVDAGVIHAAKLIADLRAFSVSGVDAGLSKGRLLTAELGKFFLPERNLRQWSEEFDRAYWTKTNASITANATTAPDGTLTADALIENTAATVTHAVNRNMPFTAGVKYTISVYVKAYQNREIGLLLGTTAVFGGSASTVIVFSPSTNTFLLTSTSVEAYGAQDVGNGWYRLYVTRTAVFTSSSSSTQIQIRQGLSGTYTGDGTSGIYIWGAQFEEGNLTDYDPVGAAAAVVTPVRKTSVLLADAGVFTVAGVDATISTNTTLIASTRAFNINGISANIIYSGGQAIAKSLYYQSIDIDPRKSIVSPVVNEDQLVYYIKGFLRIL